MKVFEEDPLKEMRMPVRKSARMSAQMSPTELAHRSGREVAKKVSTGLR